MFVPYLVKTQSFTTVYGALNRRPGDANHINAVGNDTSTSSNSCAQAATSASTAATNRHENGNDLKDNTEMDVVGNSTPEDDDVGVQATPGASAVAAPAHLDPTEENVIDGEKMQGGNN